MKGIHRESKPLLVKLSIVLIAHMVMFYLLGLGSWSYIAFISTFLVIVLFIFRSFRIPKRKLELFKDKIVAPADGKIIRIDKVQNEDLFEGECMRISIYMSFINTYMNWFPIAGKVIDHKYYFGKFLLAKKAKSSILNERKSIVIETETKHKVILTQIAGPIARHIVNYAKIGDSISNPTELGFIKFGSKIDVLIPANSKILVNPSQKTIGGKTILAELT